MPAYVRLEARVMPIFFVYFRSKYGSPEACLLESFLGETVTHLRAVSDALGSRPWHAFIFRVFSSIELRRRIWPTWLRIKPSFSSLIFVDSLLLFCGCSERLFFLCGVLRDAHVISFPTRPCLRCRYPH